MTSQCHVVELNHNRPTHGVCCKLNQKSWKNCIKIECKICLHEMHVILSHNANFDVMIVTSRHHDVIMFG